MPSKKEKQQLMHTHAELLQGLREFSDLMKNSFKNAKTCRRYYSGNQWTSLELATLKKRAQPPTVINKIKPKIDRIVGLQRRTKSDPKAFPATPKEVPAADVVTQVLNYVSNNNKFPTIESRCFKELLVEGFTACRVDYVNGEVKIKQVHADRFIFDPHSREEDFADANWLGEAIWMHVDELESAFPGANSDTITELKLDMGKAEMTKLDDDIHDDFPRFKLMDKKNKRVRVIELYYKRQGLWHQCIITESGFLIDPSVSKYKDEDQKPDHPFVAAVSLRDYEGDIFSYTTQLIDPQDSINKRTSKLLHLLSARAVRISPTFNGNKDQIRDELARPDGVIEANADEIEIIPSQDLSAGQFQLLQNAQSDLEDVGANSAIQGKVQGDLSGTAIERLQVPGLLELEETMDNLRLLKQQVFIKVFSRVRQYWKAEKAIRITDKPDSFQFIELNKKVIDPLTGKMTKANDITQVDVDIIIDEAADAINAQMETFRVLAELSAAQPGVIPVDIIIEASNLRNKDEILKKLRGEPSEEEAQAQLEEQQRAAEIEAAQVDLSLQKAEADVDETRANTQKLLAQAEAEAAEIGLDSAKLQLEAEKALIDSQNSQKPVGG